MPLKNVFREAVAAHVRVYRKCQAGGPQRALTLLLSDKAAALLDESKERQGLRNYCQAFLRLSEPGRK